MLLAQQVVALCYVRAGSGRETVAGGGSLPRADRQAGTTPTHPVLPHLPHPVLPPPPLKSCPTCPTSVAASRPTSMVAKYTPLYSGQVNPVVHPPLWRPGRRPCSACTSSVFATGPPPRAVGPQHAGRPAGRTQPRGQQAGRPAHASSALGLQGDQHNTSRQLSAWPVGSSTQHT